MQGKEAALADTRSCAAGTGVDVAQPLPGSVIYAGGGVPVRLRRVLPHVAHTETTAVSSPAVPEWMGDRESMSASEETPGPAVSVDQMEWMCELLRAAGGRAAAVNTGEPYPWDAIAEHSEQTGTAPDETR